MLGIEYEVLEYYEKENGSMMGPFSMKDSHNNSSAMRDLCNPKGGEFWRNRPPVVKSYNGSSKFCEDDFHYECLFMSGRPSNLRYDRI